MKLLRSLLFFLLAISQLNMSSQCGLSGDTLFIETQEEINSIMSCDSIFGSLSISNWEISSLDSLSNLSYIEEHFILTDNTSLLNIEALEALQYVGGSLVFENNFTLQYLDGLENLSYVGGDVFIRGNITLIDIDALSGLSQINGHLIIDENHTLENLDGFQNVQHINGDLRLENLNSILNDLQGLSSIIGIDSSLYISLPSATTIDGFDALQAVEGNVTLENMGLLASVSGFSSLVEINGTFRIEGNSNLVSLNGLENIMSIAGNLEVLNNPALFHCCGIEHLLEDTSVGEEIIIENNSNGCNNAAEIIEDCFVHVDEFQKEEPRIIINEQGLKIIFDNSAVREVSVYSYVGKRVLHFPFSKEKSLDVLLPLSGLFVVQIVEDGIVYSKSIIR